MFRKIVWTCIVAIGLLPLYAQEKGATAGELIQYIRDARKAGLNDQQIQKNAVGAGWSEAAIAKAITTVGSTAKVQAAAPVDSAPAVEVVSASRPSTVDAKQPAPGGITAAESKPESKPVNPPAAESPTPGPAPGLKIPATSGPGKPPAQDRGVPDDYQIGAGDVIQINVWKEPEASVPSGVVRPDGKISMPLVKDVAVVGLTPKQVEQLITEQLSRFINGADVTVVVSGINSKKVYLIGAVKKEGPLAYTYRMSIMQALSEAGGLTDYAKRKKIYVLRTENGRQFRLPFDYDAVLKGERMELNIPLLAGDTIVVPH
jgi:polysaccharide export outer membrane protein